MNKLNYHHLMYFREIATQGSVSKAAEKLKLGQPALSGQLKTLEASLGYSLFERKNRKLCLTDTGVRVLQYANDIYQAGNSLVDMLEKGLLTTKMRLNIGALDCVPKHLILQLITDAVEISPCQVNVVEGSFEFLYGELQAHNLDIIISNYHAPISDISGIYSRSLTKHAISVFAAPTFKHLKMRFPSSLNTESFVLPSFHNKLRHDIDHFFRLNDIDYKVFSETQDTSIQKLLCAKGCGLIALADYSAQEMVNDKKLIKLGEIESVFEEFWIISAKKTIENPIASHLAKHFLVRP
jgi:LysR family transcriptional activator of nhaA